MYYIKGLKTYEVVLINIQDIYILTLNINKNAVWLFEYFRSSVETWGFKKQKKTEWNRMIISV